MPPIFPGEPATPPHTRSILVISLTAPPVEPTFAYTTFDFATRYTSYTVCAHRTRVFDYTTFHLFFYYNYATYTSLPSMVLILVYTGYGNFTIFFIYTSLNQQIISISPQTMVYTTYITLIQPALYHPTYTIHTSITHSIPLIAFIHTIYIIPVKTTSTQPTLYISLLRNLYHIHYVYHQYQPYH